MIQRLWVRISGPAGIEGGDCEWTALSPPSIPWLRCPWARHRTPNCSLGAGAMAAHCSGCVFTAVCVHLDGLNAEDQFRVWVTWQYITYFFTYILDNTSHIFLFISCICSISYKCLFGMLVCTNYLNCDGRRNRETNFNGIVCFGVLLWMPVFCFVLFCFVLFCLGLVFVCFGFCFGSFWFVLFCFGLVFVCFVFVIR